MNQKGFVNIWIVVLVLALLGVGGYFAFVKNSVPPQESSPTDVSQKQYLGDENIGKAVGGGPTVGEPLQNQDLLSRIPEPKGQRDWRVFASHAGYKFRYPADKIKILCTDEYISDSRPPEQCGGIMIIKIGAQKDKKGLPTGVNYNTDFMNVQSRSNPNNVSLREFYAEMWGRAEWSDVKIDNREAVFSIISRTETYNTFGEKLSAPVQLTSRHWLIDLPNDQPWNILGVSITANYSDGMTQFYEEILSTFSFVR